MSDVSAYINEGVRRKKSVLFVKCKMSFELVLF